MSTRSDQPVADTRSTRPTIRLCRNTQQRMSRAIRGAVMYSHSVMIQTKPGAYVNGMLIRGKAVVVKVKRGCRSNG